ncbi:type Z 30S ribosomal protein S14 [Candidatus Gracilibacteria bacterium]|nr:type Z 30S ribosomal protein S14 [Candidatus Gracilibacteria bacterium]MCF7856626.1 type Z 30S ribosomal protein S14 [Candidatus Gracilibacteria bacterium]MCF7896926.1 type Z 30S ribosomal protein S14 [Candidatus Gracilibacteria bacterium]
MAKTSSIVKSARFKRKVANALAVGAHPKKATRVINRCRICGRNRGYMRRFEMCRICFRELASRGEIVGVKKSSW